MTFLDTLEHPISCKIISYNDCKKLINKCYYKRTIPMESKNINYLENNFNQKICFNKRFVHCPINE